MIILEFLSGKWEVTKLPVTRPHYSLLNKVKLKETFAIIVSSYKDSFIVEIVYKIEKNQVDL